MSKDIVWHEHAVTKEERARQKRQKPCLLWFTGLSGAGKSSIANALDQALYHLGYHTFLLDGDNVRHGLNNDLGFNDKDRIENIRRIGEASKLFTDAGLIVMSAFISPFISDRRLVRELFPEGEFIEVHVNTPLAVCEERDPKGLYKKPVQVRSNISPALILTMKHQKPLKSRLIQQIIPFNNVQSICYLTYQRKA